MKKIFYYKFDDWQLLVFIGALFMLLFSGVVHAQVNITAPSTYVFNYTNELNATSGEVFACFNNQTSLSWNLVHGETKILITDSLNASVYCAAENTSTGSLCSFSRILAPGENLDLQSGSCNLDLRCEKTILDEDDDTLCLDSGDVNYSKDYRIRRDNNKVIFSFDGEDFSFPFTVNDTFDFTSQIKYSCPANLELDTDQIGPELSSICEKATPFLLQWYDKTITSYTDLQSNCNQFKDESVATSGQFQADLTQCNDEKRQCESDKEVQRNNYQTCDSEKVVLSDKVDNQMMTIMLLLVWCITASVIAIIFAVKSYEKDEP